MPKILKAKTQEETPDTIRPYTFHRVELDKNGGEWVGDCPFCGRERKFSVSEKTGQWRCFVCQEGTEKGGGGKYTFLQVLHKLSEDATTNADYQKFAAQRGLLHPETLIHWGVCRSAIDGTWLVPGYDAQGNLCQLYRYRYLNNDGRYALLLTPTCKHRIHGVNLFSQDKQNVYVTEGVWDGMALWETMQGSKQDGETLAPTASNTANMLADANVLAIPTCTAFNGDWCDLFEGKDVTLMCDNDHPRKGPTGKLLPPAALAGTQRIVKVIGETPTSDNPETISWLAWGGDEGFDASLPSGTDIRDMLTGDTLRERTVALDALLQRIRPIPQEWLSEAATAAKKTQKDAPGIELVPCSSYRDLVLAWRKAVKWSEGLDTGLVVMLASIASTKQIGDQLWVKILGPASCGKSTLCEAISTASEFVHAKSTIRGFHSGFGDGQEDHSLVSKCKGKTLVVKDGDTLLQSPNLGQILSEARDVYDTVSRTSYRNQNSRDYSGIRMTWILCGTASLKQIDTSELGERFLDCVIMDGIDEELEDEILWRVVNRARSSLRIEAGEEADKQQDPEMTNAMAMTGGYVTYLRENVRHLVQEVDATDEELYYLTRLGKFVAYMRARPSKIQNEKAEREFAARLTSQLLRLANFVAVVLNRKSLDEEVMRRVRKVAMDTSRGPVLKIMKAIYKSKTKAGLDSRTISVLAGLDYSETQKLLRFLRELEAVSLESVNGKKQALWKLTPSLRKLYGIVSKEI